MDLCHVSKGMVHYKIEGEGIPILILHPLGTDYRSMHLWLEPLFTRITGFQRIYIDLPGHGKSTTSKQVKTTDDMLQYVLEFIEVRLDKQLFSMIGCSFGGYLAQGIIDRKINQVKSSCLLAPVLHLKERNLPKKLIYSDHTDDLINEQSDSDVKKAYDSLIIFQNRENANRFLNEIQPGRLLVNKEVINIEWKQYYYLLSKIPLANVKNSLPRLLVIVGKQDHICGYKDHFNFFNNFPHAKCKVIDQAGHMLHIEQRDLVLQWIEDWLVDQC